MLCAYRLGSRGLTGEAGNHTIVDCVRTGKCAGREEKLVIGNPAFGCRVPANRAAALGGGGRVWHTRHPQRTESPLSFWWATCVAWAVTCQIWCSLGTTTTLVQYWRAARLLLTPHGSSTEQTTHKHTNNTHANISTCLLHLWFSSCNIRWLGHKVFVQSYKQNCTQTFSRYNCNQQDQVVGPQTLCTTLQKYCTPSFSRYTNNCSAWNHPARSDYADRGKAPKPPVSHQRPTTGAGFSRTVFIRVCIPIRGTRGRGTTNTAECAGAGWVIASWGSATPSTEPKITCKRSNRDRPL